jgi:hypothetical protein
MEGLCMALQLFEHPTTGELMLIAGYEDGYLYLFSVSQGMICRARFHDDPCLCVEIDPTRMSGVIGSAGTSIGVFSVGYEKVRIN